MKEMKTDEDKFSKRLSSVETICQSSNRNEGNLSDFIHIIIFEMKFVCNFSIYVLIIIFTREIWVVRCTTDFAVNELKYLSEKLDPTECLKLLDAVYHGVTVKQETSRVEKIHKTIRRDLGKSWVTRENCLFQLQNWHKHFSGRGNIRGREAMEDALRSLGKYDLARYIRKNRSDYIIDRFIKTGDFFENNEHDPSRGHVPLGYEKELVSNENKYMKRNGHTKGFRHHKLEEIKEKDDSNLYPTQLIITGEILKGNDSDSKEQVEVKNKTSERDYDAYWIILITVITLGIMSICATGVFLIYRKNCNRFINGRLCREWALKQEGQKICVCCCGKQKETSRKADVDMESGWSGRCSKCWLDPKGDNKEKSRSKQETICVQKSKKSKKKKIQPKAKEKIHRKEEKKAARNKALEKEMKSQKCKRTATSEPSHTDFKEMQNKIDYLQKNDYKSSQCSCTSEETECIATTTRKEKKKEKNGWYSGSPSPQLKEKKRMKERRNAKNSEKLFQYDSGSPCIGKTCEWRKIAKEKRYGKNSA